MAAHPDLEGCTQRKCTGALMEYVQKLLNELPTILVAVWGVLNALGVNASEEDREAVLSGLQSLGAFGIWLLVRRNTDGPVTALNKAKDDNNPAGEDDVYSP